MAGGGYTQLTRSELIDKVDNFVKTNANNEITGAILNSVLLDLAKSQSNAKDDSVGLKDYDTVKQYKEGDTCFADGEIKRALADTSGAYDAELWTSANPLIRSMSRSDFNTLKNNGQLKVGYYHINNSKVDLGVIIQVIAPNVMAPKAFGLFLEPNYNGDVIGVWRETLIVLEYDNLDGSFEVGEKVFLSSGIQSGSYGTVVSDTGSVLVLKDLSSSNLVWNNNDSLLGETSEATCDLDGVGVVVFPVNINELVAWNGLMYRNLVSVNTSDSPADDADNWEVLPKALENGYKLDVCLINYSSIADEYTIREDIRGNVINMEQSFFQFGHNDVVNNYFPNAKVWSANNRGQFKGNSCLSHCDILVDNRNEGKVSNNVFAGSCDYELFAKQGKEFINNFVIATGGSFIHDGENIKNQVVDVNTQDVAPLTGDNVIVKDYIKRVVINPAGTIADFEVILNDASVYDGKEVSIVSTQSITTLVVSSDFTIINPPTTINAGGTVKLTFLKSANSWVRS